MHTTIDDFAVRLTDDHRLELVSVSRGRIAWFPAWEHADRDLRHFIAADVPMGSADLPYEDVDDEWRIRIYEQQGFVYIEENDARWRVPTQRYIEAWAALIDAFNPVEPV
ncbi:MAG TPA: hypothetical protein VF824_03930 [Thermoanaerobaculia bacterium]